MTETALSRIAAALESASARADRADRERAEHERFRDALRTIAEGDYSDRAAAAVAIRVLRGPADD